MKPKLTRRIIEAIVNCTSVAINELDATEGDKASPWTAQERKAMRDADQWARKMREYRDEQKKANAR